MGDDYIQMLTICKRLGQTNTRFNYFSGSGLDPHISVEAAYAQIERVAKAQSLSANDIKRLIAKNTDGRFFKIFGEPGINVLRLNLALNGKPNS